MAKQVKLKDILKLEPYMKILIDEEVERDEEKNFLINVAYERVSTDRQAETGYGLDIQENEIIRYAKNNNYKNLVVFIDDGYTGTNKNRPALQGIISYITDFNEGYSNIRVSSFIVPRMDRLARSLFDTLVFIQDYIVAAKTENNKSKINKNKEDINFVSIQENYCRVEKNNPQGKFLLMLFATLAEFDRDVIVDKLYKGKTARASSGKWTNGPTPKGYKMDRNTGLLVVVPEEAEKIKEVFRLYVDEGLSPQKIADRLGFTSDSYVRKILVKKVYAGYVPFSGEYYQGLHAPIVSLETWERAQEMLDSRKVVKSESYYLLTGLVYCGDCGTRMKYCVNNKRKTKKIICYASQTLGSNKKPRVGPKCPNSLFNADAIENAVVNQLMQMSYLQSSTSREEKEKSTKNDALEVLNAELKKNERKLCRLYDLIEDDNEDDILITKIKDLRRRISSIKQQIKTEKENQSTTIKIDRAKEIILNLKNCWDLLSPKEKQRICRGLIDKVVISSNGTVDVFLKLDAFMKESEET